ncbi:MAG: DUF2125 domain-containing protein [Beijerinckiaceae bacterium]|jgi:hypothetical protein|nr:DUF2125 domain-containing protein [Beijerinckiaceae bacterium]
MQRRFRWLIILVVAVCVLWTGAWYYAASFAGKAADAWIAKQASDGRNWTCVEREIGGFPFRMLIRCKSLAFEGPVRGGMVKLTTGSVRAIAQIYNPKLILAEVDGPLKLALPGGDKTMEATWTTLRASVRAAKPVPERISVRVEKLAAQFRSATGVQETIAIADAEFHLRPAPDVKADFGATDLAVLINMAESGSANRLTGEAAPVNASIVSRITRAPLLLSGPRNQRLEQWRLGNGVLTLQNSRITKGPLQIDANGQLKLDDEHRPSGKINLRAAGVGGVLKKFGLPDISAAGGLLGGLLGNRNKAKPDDREKPKAFIPLPLVLQDGNLQIGPFRTGVRIKPLY